MFAYACGTYHIRRTHVILFYFNKNACDHHDNIKVNNFNSKIFLILISYVKRDNQCDKLVQASFCNLLSKFIVYLKYPQQVPSLYERL